MGSQSGRYVIGANKLPAAISWNSVMHVCNIWPHLNHTFHAYSFMVKRKATISRYVVVVVLSWRYIHPRMLLTCSSKSCLMIIMGWQFGGREKPIKSVTTSEAQVIVDSFSILRPTFQCLFGMLFNVRYPTTQSTSFFRFNQKVKIRLQHLAKMVFMRKWRVYVLRLLWEVLKLLLFPQVISN